MSTIKQTLLLCVIVIFAVGCKTKNKISEPTPPPPKKDVSLYAIQFYQKYYPNGNKKKKYSTYKGKTNGRFETWYDSGQQKQVSHWKNGIQHGKTTFWYLNGNMQHQLKYDNGTLQDSAYFYHFNGKLKSKGVFVDNKKESNWKFYDTLGHHYLTRIMVNDIQIDSVVIPKNSF